MSEIQIPSIDKHLRPFRNKRIAVCPSQFDYEEDYAYEIYKTKSFNDREVANLKLRNRVDAFCSRMENKVERIFIGNNFKEKNPNIIVCTDEIVYKAAKKAIKFKQIFDIPVLIEFHEDSWDSVSQNIIWRMVNEGEEWILESLCYLTSIPKDPRSIEF